MLGPVPTCWLSSRQAESPEHAFYCTRLGTKCLTPKYNITAALSHLGTSMQRTVRLLTKAYVQCSTLQTLTLPQAGRHEGPHALSSAHRPGMERVPSMLLVSTPHCRYALACPNVCQNSHNTCIQGTSQHNFKICPRSGTQRGRARLLLYSAQVGQHNAKAHGDDQHEHARQRFAQAAQQHRVQRGHVRPEPRCVEVDVVKVPVQEPRSLSACPSSTGLPQDLLQEKGSTPQPPGGD